MNVGVRDAEKHLVDPDMMPLARIPATDERRSVLANSLRRVAEATQRDPQETVAAFNNYV